MWLAVGAIEGGLMEEQNMFGRLLAVSCSDFLHSMSVRHVGIYWDFLVRTIYPVN